MIPCPDLSQLRDATKHLEHCEACRALAAAARSIELPNAESPACARVWPLLAVADDRLGPLDRGARDAHLAACARCRRIALDTWLDEVPVRAAAPASLPAAVVLPELPARRRTSRARLVLAAGSLAAAACGAVAFELVHLANRPSAHVATPARTVAVDDPVSAALARLDHGDSPAVVRDELRTISSTNEYYPFALYWIAVMSIQHLDDWDAARDALARLEPLHIYNPWLGPWTLIRKAQLAEHDGRVAEARELWGKAKAETYRDADYTEFLDAAIRKYGL